jgi:4-amino-4-deoxy-L-arabinose transferase-like glycosyltransferase
VIGAIPRGSAAARGGPARAGRLARRAGSRWGLTFALVAAAGLVMRVWTYRSLLGVPNSDEAVVGLMVRHALHGQLTTFFWGSAYGGPQEVLLAAPLFWIFGSGWLVLRIVPIALTAITSLVIWRVGRRTIGEPAGAVAGALFWVWPPFVIRQLTLHQSFYATDVLYCALLLLLGLRIVERPSRFRVGLFGLVLGLAFWQTAQIVPIAVTVIGWTIWRKPQCLRHLWLATLLALVGSLPWTIWNAAHDWQSLGVHAGLSAYEHSLRIFVSPIMPMTIGLRAPFQQALLVPSSALTYLIYAALVGLFLCGALKARRRDASILSLVAALFPFVYAISRLTGELTGWPQYTVVLTPVLALLFAQLATSYLRGAVLLAVMCLVSAVSLHRMNLWFQLPQPQPNAPRNFGPLIATLDRLHVSHVYADYWIAYVLDFDSHERIVAVENTFTGVSFRHGQAYPSVDDNIRYPPYEREVRSAHHGFVFFRRKAASISIIPKLEQHGYRPSLVGPFVVYAQR